MKRIDLDSMPSLFERVGLKPTQCDFISRGRPSSRDGAYCGCIVSALYLREHPLATKEDVLEADLAWLDMQIEKPDSERNLLTHPCVLGLARMGFTIAYLDGLIVGWDGLSLRCQSRNWLTQDEESDEALDYVAGVIDGRLARRRFNPTL